MFQPKSLLLAALLACCLPLRAEVRLHASFGDHMVLQQQSVTMLRGTAGPGEKVTVRCSWEQDRHSVKAAADGNWQIPLTTPSGGFEPQWIEVKERNTVRIDDVLIGEVWLCAGQSNMEMPMRGFRWLRSPLRRNTGTCAFSTYPTPVPRLPKRSAAANGSAALRNVSQCSAPSPICSDGA